MINDRISKAGPFLKHSYSGLLLGRELHPVFTLSSELA